MSKNGFDAINLGNDTPALDSEHVIRQAYEKPDNKMREIVDANERVVMNYSEQLVAHFSNTLFNLPEKVQRDFIDSISVFNDRNDVIYNGLRQKYEAKERGLAC